MASRIPEDTVSQSRRKFAASTDGPRLAVVTLTSRLELGAISFFDKLNTSSRTLRARWDREKTVG
jgi:hypothetical protein